MTDYPLRMALLKALRYFKSMGIIVEEFIEAIKVRDPKEPGRERKLKAEKRMSIFWRKVFARQKELIASRATSLKKLSDYDFLFDDQFDLSDDEEAELINMWTDFLMDGVHLFGEANPIGLDYTLVNARAAKKAREAALFLKGEINQTSTDAIRQALEAFVTTPGMTIGDVVDLLPFSEERSWSIATTEITRVYADAELQAGDEMKEQFPDVPVVKEWFTNNDDLVCEICGPMHEMTVDLDEPFVDDFGGEYEAPPAHTNCRCFVSVHTEIERA